MTMTYVYRVCLIVETEAGSMRDAEVYLTGLLDADDGTAVISARGVSSRQEAS